MVIGVDIDGIVAKFNNNFASIITKQTGIVYPQEDDTWPNTWYWDIPVIIAAGHTPEEAKIISRNAWKVVKESSDFWWGLPPYVGAPRFLQDLYTFTPRHDVYFITQRLGIEVKDQTKNWIGNQGFFSPTVLVSGEKGEVCHALNITHYIDDKNENCIDVLLKSPSTKCFMLKRPWNEQVPAVPRLNKLNEFLEILKNGEQEGV